MQMIKSFVFQHPSRRLDYDVYQAGRSELGDRPVEKGRPVSPELFRTDEKTHGS
jgi:hypothetical protein